MPEKHSRLETFGPLSLAGIWRCHRVRSDDEALSSAVALQWRDLLRAAVRISTLLPPMGYGAGFHFDPAAEMLEFFCGFVAPRRLPEGLRTVEIPESACAVFRHSGQISLLRHTLNAIFETALPLAGRQRLDSTIEAPSFILRARPSLNPLTGFGGVDVLVPITP